MKKLLISSLFWLSPTVVLADPLQVLASFSIVGNLVQEIGGERVNVTTLVGADQDAHVYQPAPQDVKKLNRASVFVVNGLGFEGWVSRLAKSSGFKGKTVIASAGIAPQNNPAGQGEHGHSGQDPHAWHNPQNVKVYVRNIAAALTQADPSGKDYYAQRLTRYAQQLDEADTFARNAVLTQAFAATGKHTLHILGLLSDGGVHSHEAHLHAVFRAAQAAGVGKVRFHAFLDGRDTPPRSADTYLTRLDAVLADCPNVRLASVCGRFWAMDRDKRWERVASAYQLVVDGEAAFRADSGHAALAGRSRTRHRRAGSAFQRARPAGQRLQRPTRPRRPGAPQRGEQHRQRAPGRVDGGGAQRWAERQHAIRYAVHPEPGREPVGATGDPGHRTLILPCRHERQEP